LYNLTAKEQWLEENRFIDQRNCDHSISEKENQTDLTMFDNFGEGKRRVKAEDGP